MKSSSPVLYIIFYHITEGNAKKIPDIFLNHGKNNGEKGDLHERGKKETGAVGMRRSQTAGCALRAF